MSTMQQAKILDAVVRRIGDFSTDPARRRAYEISESKARARFFQEQDGSDEQVSFIITEMGNLEANYGPQLHVAGMNAGYRGESRAVSDPDYINYRKRRDAEAAKKAAEAKARATRPQPFLGEGIAHQIASDAKTGQCWSGSPSTWPKRDPWRSG